jgi:hypothetical protein
MEVKVHRCLHRFSSNINNVPDDIYIPSFEPKLVECRTIPPERIGINGEYDITLCLQVEGATSVEINGVSLAPRSRPIVHFEPNQYLLNAS